MSGIDFWPVATKCLTVGNTFALKSLLSRHYSSHMRKISWRVSKLTSGTAVQNSQFIDARATVVCSSSIIPNDSHLLVALELSHGSYMSLASVLLSPSPVWSPDNSIADVFHLKCGDAKKRTKITAEVINHFPSFCIDLTCDQALFSFRSVTHAGGKGETMAFRYGQNLQVTKETKWNAYKHY